MDGGSLTSALLNGSFELCDCVSFCLPGYFWNSDGVKGEETPRRAAQKEFQIGISVKFLTMS